MLSKITVYVPNGRLEAVKDAMFASGAGTYGNYDRCSWETSGMGQFRPLSNANPHTGTVGSVEKVSEIRVEMVCQDTLLKNVLAAMLESHPYEEPAYDVVPIKTLADL